MTASPWVVIPLLTWTPIEPIFFAAPASPGTGAGPSVQTPVSPLIVCAPTPCSASEPIITRSSPRT